jgi:hypothetical protein
MMNTLRLDQRYVRFEPITVRAAARVVELQWAGVIPAQDAPYYLRELLAMDAHAGEAAFPNLVRAAQRRAATLRMVVKAKEAIRRTTRSATGALSGWAPQPLGQPRLCGTGTAVSR